MATVEANSWEWLERALQVLERLEWSGTANYGEYTAPQCPACKGVKKTKVPNFEDIYVGAGHRQGCELACLLENRPDLEEER